MRFPGQFQPPVCHPPNRLSVHVLWEIAIHSKRTVQVISVESDKHMDTTRCVHKFSVASAHDPDCVRVGDVIEKKGCDRH